MATPTFVNSPFRKTQFVDLNTNYSSSGPLQVFDTNAIENMMTNIIMTEKGSYHFEPLLGTEVPDLIFENPNEKTAFEIIDEIYYGVQEWLGNLVTLSLADSKVYADTVQGGFYVVVAYSISGAPSINYLTLKLSATQ